MATDRPKVLLAMSGGVDSSVAAALLLDRGFDVVGVFMRLGSPGEEFDRLVEGDRACAVSPGKIVGGRGCCSVGDAEDARTVAGHLGIPFYVVNFKKEFGRIIDYFVDEYAAGRTPNPCVRCNEWLKFGRLWEYAAQVGAQFVATGHYARVRDGRLMRGVSSAKDQSYVLFGVQRARVESMVLPVGDYEKPAIREMARERGLPVFDKPDSQEICFVPDDDYAGLVERRRPDLVREGELVDASGAVIGAHGGHHRFTIGQRRGLGVARGVPLYVLDKDPATNRVTVGGPDGLMARGCGAREVNLLCDAAELAEWRACFARYRSNGELAPARARVVGAGEGAMMEVEFGAPRPAVAAGQAVVLYADDDPDVVLGGGWIDRVDRGGALPG
jgi:tRNA-specific 2-thiouridylase